MSIAESKEKNLDFRIEGSLCVQEILTKGRLVITEDDLKSIHFAIRGPSLISLDLKEPVCNVLEKVSISSINRKTCKYLIETANQLQWAASDLKIFLVSAHAYYCVHDLIKEEKESHWREIFNNHMKAFEGQ